MCLRGENLSTDQYILNIQDMTEFDEGVFYCKGWINGRGLHRRSFSLVVGKEQLMAAQQCTNTYLPLGSKRTPKKSYKRHYKTIYKSYIDTTKWSVMFTNITN
ncbi:hypothetical protein DPMN_091994 [Dreissena polymorpha]|uniref:Uncharacterized protein n=1 Tax=Dreissena polymorpha TaxID=45954 RepID=A0A9D4L0V2_DREPO|nr:hypothetical protein DPMN_091994 [Dreissena polymorpha]